MITVRISAPDGHHMARLPNNSRVRDQLAKAGVSVNSRLIGGYSATMKLADDEGFREALHFIINLR